jgi:hypothetical protein
MFGSAPVEDDTGQLSSKKVVGYFKGRIDIYDPEVKVK